MLYTCKKRHESSSCLIFLLQSGLYSWHCYHSTPSCSSVTNYRVGLKLDYVNDVLEDLDFQQLWTLWMSIDLGCLDHNAVV